MQAWAAGHFCKDEVAGSVMLPMLYGTNVKAVYMAYSAAAAAASPHDMGLGTSSCCLAPACQHAQETCACLACLFISIIMHLSHL
jgi:hypothetical protein